MSIYMFIYVCAGGMHFYLFSVHGICVHERDICVCFSIHVPRSHMTPPLPPLLWAVSQHTLR